MVRDSAQPLPHLQLGRDWGNISEAGLWPALKIIHVISATLHHYTLQLVYAPLTHS
jgi:hypothetical protein